MSNGYRSAEKETSWRVHVGWQASSGVSVRAYCREYGLSEPSFHWWRREIRKRDAEQECHRRRSRVSLSVADRIRSTESDVFASGLTQKQTVGDQSESPRHSSSVGLIALDIVCDAAPPSMVRPILEIECSGGVVIRLREEVSAEVLQRVIVACQERHSAAAAKVATAIHEVRSC